MTVREVLNVSVKAGQYLSEKDQCQLKLELLPLLIKQDCALGLLICAGEATLFQVKRESSGLVFFRQHYVFNEGKLFENFGAMCRDIVFYSQ